MLKIIKDKNEKIVTKGAYESFYKPLGYIIVGDKKESDNTKEIKKDNENKVIDNESAKKQDLKKEVNRNRKTNEVKEK